MTLENLERRKSLLTREELDIQNKAGDVIVGLINRICVWVALSSVMVSMQNKFFGASISSICGALLMLAVGWRNAFANACCQIRGLTGSMEDLKRRRALLSEDAKQLAVEIHKYRQAFQSKVTPVMEEDFQASVADISYNIDINWLSRQEFFEKRLQRVMVWHVYGDLEGDYMLYIKRIAIFWISLLICFVMLSYYFYVR